MFSLIRKTFSYLVLAEFGAMIAAVLMTKPPENYTNSAHDPLFGVVLLGWLGFSFFHAILASSGNPERLTALGGLAAFGALVWYLWVTPDITPGSAPTIIYADWQAMLIIGAFLIPPINQVLDIFLPPWPWSKKD